MWFCCHHWHQGTLEVLLALPLCHSSNLSLRCLFRLMPNIGPQLVGFLSELDFSPFLNVLVFVMVYAFCFKVPWWMLYSHMEAQPLWFALLQPFGAYPWQAYVKPDDGHWPTPGTHRVAAPSTALSRGRLLLLNQLSPSHSNYMVGNTALGTWQRVILSLHFPYMVGRGLPFYFWFHPMTHLILNLWWTLNLVIVVWWLGIRLMSFLTSGLQSSLLLIPTFILHLWVRCHHLPTFIWNPECEDSHIYPAFMGKVSSLNHFHLEPRVWRLFLSGPSCCWLWTGLGFHPHWFHQDTGFGYIFG